MTLHTRTSMPPKRAAPLPTKERGLFVRLLTEYETKKHRLALKTADAILKLSLIHI